MAFDFNTFKVRASSAVVFGAIMLLALLGPSSIFVLVFAVVTFIAAKEYYTIQCAIQKQTPQDTVAIMYAIGAAFTYLAIAQEAGLQILKQYEGNFNIFIGAVLLLIILWNAMLKFSAFGFRLLIGYLYIAVSFGLLAHLYASNHYLPLFLIVCIWVNDTMQYLVGSFLGKTKMAPIISPKKTWEGTIGGSALCVLVAIIWSAITNQFSIGVTIVIAACASIVGTLGDLLESKLKRTAGIKDSGNIMPGHGGALDRFDSILLAAPVAFIVLNLLGLL